MTLNSIIKTGKFPIIKYISAKNIKKKRKFNIPKSKWIKNPITLTKKKDVDLIIELILSFLTTSTWEYLDK